MLITRGTWSGIGENLFACPTMAPLSFRNLGSSGSILLKKSVFTYDPNFAEALVRLPENYLGDLIISSPFNERLSQIVPRQLVASNWLRPMPNEKSLASRFRLFNNIGHTLPKCSVPGEPVYHPIADMPVRCGKRR
jgi:hypothetical protein